MEMVIEIKNKLLKKREKILKSLSSAKRARDSAPSATESHSDTLRSESEKLYNALLSELKNIDDLISMIPINNISFDSNKVEVWRCATVVLNNEKFLVYVVPEGLGGEEINGIRLISINSPLGEAIIDRSISEEFELNGNRGKILDISQG